MDRRAFLLGLSAGASIGPSAVAADRETINWTRERLFASGPLAKNRLASFFVMPSGSPSWPDGLRLLDRRGVRTVRDWRGRTVLVAMWAEWCAPCLAEMPSLARLGRMYGGERFAIKPVLTGSHTLRTVAEAQARLARLPGAQIETLADGSSDGSEAMHRLAGIELPAGLKLPPGAVVKGATALPCLVLVDPRGRIRGRAVGAPREPSNLWDTPEADAFIQALSKGALEESAQGHETP